MAYGPRSQPLSARRKLQPAQSEARVRSNLISAVLTGDTMQFIFDVPITTGSGFLIGAYYIAGGFPTIYHVNMSFQDEVTFNATDTGWAFSDLVWVHDAGIWRTSANGVPEGEAQFYM